jgi:riboflavin kinase/FMN adenylyltransferase
VIEIPAKEVDEVNVSSTKIRNALLQGDIEMANVYLNQPYEISGIVTKGKQLGRTIGFPTANVKVQESTKLIPINGVYAVRIAIEGGENLNAMMNIGTRPTVSNEAQQSIEVNIFDFNEDIYDKLVKVSLFKRIRSEEKFPNLEALKIQIAKDEALIRSYFGATLVS